ncbi:MAG: hypothetical protein IPM29_21670 [Planctomycetes bacterium]|nr:hypothetical protein [Planctomycetota bacterium]
MPEPPADVAPRGAPRTARFEGLLAGRRRDDAALRSACDALRRLGVAADLELRGGRFSLLPDDATIAGEHLDEAGQTALLDVLAQMIAAAEPGSVESTLRCTLVHDDRVVETLFAVQRDALRPVSRVRPPAPGDRAAATADDDRDLGRVARRKLLRVAPLLLIACALLAWQSGLADRALAPRPAALRCETGVFGDRLAIDVARDAWLGGYVVSITRGPGYPATIAAAERAEATATTPVERAALRALADGSELWVRLLGADGRVLAAVSGSLAPLLESADARVRVELPPRRVARGVRLALDPGSGG